MLHTGLHDDYHRPSDDSHKINAEGLKQIARLMFNILVELADAPTLGGFRRQSRLESRGAQQLSERGLPVLPGRLGIRIDGKAAAEGKAVVASVTPGSAADKAGLRSGDRIVKFADREILDATRFQATVLAAISPAQATLERAGASEPVEVTIELAGEPVRLGISWRTDDAEPGTVIVSRVIPGAPADLAGLRVGDRIDRIGGREFATSDAFRRLVGETPGRFTLAVETAGRVRTVEVVPEQSAAIAPDEE
jgi:S1-C subfamily serine protease